MYRYRVSTHNRCSWMAPDAIYGYIAGITLCALRGAIRGLGIYHNQRYGITAIRAKPLIQGIWAVGADTGAQTPDRWIGGPDPDPQVVRSMDPGSRSSGPGTDPIGSGLRPSIHGS